MSTSTENRLRDVRTRTGLFLSATLLSACVGDLSGGVGDDASETRPDAGASVVDAADSGEQSPDASSSDVSDANTDASANSDAPDAESPPEEEISFFYGYFTYDNYLSEMEGHSNVVLGPSTFAFIEEAKSRGIKPIVWLTSVLQLWDIVGDKAYLKSNYLEIWNAYAEQLEPYIDDIYGFYPVDEPFWASKLTVQEQDALNAAIKASFPNKPIMTTFARPTIEDSSFVVPSTYDYVGYDNYYGSSFDSDAYYYEVLKGKLSAGQKIFLVGDAFVPDFSVTQADQELRADKIHLAYQLATTPGEPIVGILSYVWHSFSVNWPGTGEPYYIGLRDMPIAKEQFVLVGQTVLGGE